MNLTTVHSLWLAPLCVLLGVALAWWLYKRRSDKEEFPRNLAILLAVLRAMALALLAFFLLEPMLRLLVTEVRKPVVVIAHDGSASLLATGDTVALRSTYQAELQSLARALEDRYELRSFTYGQEVREGLQFEQADGLTDISQLFREVYDRFSGPDLGAVIIDGDGIQNRGRDPRLEAARLGVPIHVIALGDTTVRPDLVLKGVEHNRINYLGNEFPLLARVEARYLAGRSTRVSVLQNGRELTGRDLAITGDPFFLELPFAVKADKPGLQKFTVQLRELDGEASVVNNAQDVYVEVLDDRQKVLLVGAAPHPDLGAIRQALLGMEGYATELVFANDLPAKPEDYDLIVLHQLPSAKQPIASFLQRAAQQGVPITYVLGGAVDLNALNALGAGVKVSGWRASTTDALGTVNKELNLFTLEQEHARAIERFPPLQVPFGIYEAQRGTSVIIKQRVGAIRTDQPLVAVSQQGGRRVAIIAGEGLWRWRLADHQQNGTHRNFDLLVHKLVQYTALKLDRNRFRVEHAREFAGNEAVLMSAELYNASLEPVNGPEVTIVLEDEEGRDFPYTFTRRGTGYRLDAGRLPAGRYTWKARTELDGTAHSAAGELVVRDQLAELLSTVADHALLADLAARSEGVLVKPGGLAAIEQAIRQRPEIVARSFSQASYSDLIGLRWIFFIILAMLTAEWVLRRRNGAY